MTSNVIAPSGTTLGKIIVCGLCGGEGKVDTQKPIFGVGLFVDSLICWGWLFRGAD